MTNQKITITVFDKEQYDGEWPPESLPDAIGWFQSKLDMVPQEHRSTATIEISGIGGYEGSAYAEIVIKYTRMETNEECAARSAKAAQRQEDIRQSELRHLAQLKAKYKE